MEEIDFLHAAAFCMNLGQIAGFRGRTAAGRTVFLGAESV